MSYDGIGEAVRANTTTEYGTFKLLTHNKGNNINITTHGTDASDNVAKEKQKADSKIRRYSTNMPYQTYMLFGVTAIILYKMYR